MTDRLDRRSFLRNTALGGAALAVAPLAGARGQDKPIRIGLLTVKTGPLAAGGLQMEQGATVFLKQRGYMLSGRKVELVVADTGGNPAGAKTKTQELVERDKVDFIFGPLAAFEALAIGDYIAQGGTPLLSQAAAEDLTQRKANQWFIRPSVTSAQCAHPAAHWMATEKKWKRVATISEDFAFGHEQMGGFQRVFEDNGGKVVAKLWPPLNTPDYSPYLAQLAQIKNLDAIFMGFAGGNPVKFMRQYADYGLQGKIPLMGGVVAVDDALLKSFGDEALGVLSSSFYSTDIDTPSNKRLIADMVKDYQNLPGYYAVCMYQNGQIVEAALEKTGGKTDDKKALMEVMRGLKLTDTPRGPIHFDHLGNAVGNVYIREIQKRNGQLVNAVLKTYPDVSQFWTYEEKAFLGQPVYSRDYPPAKNLEL